MDNMLTRTTMIIIAALFQNSCRYDNNSRNGCSDCVLTGSGIGVQNLGDSMSLLGNNLRIQIDGSEGSFVDHANRTNQFDWESFKGLTEVLFDVANQYGGKDECPKWIMDGFTELKNEVPRILIQLQGVEMSLLQEQVTLIDDLWFFFSEGEPPYDLETLELLSKDR